jgi:hypothetical protein
MRPLRLLVAPLCLATLGLATKPANAQQTGTLTVSNILWKDRPNKTLMSNTLNRDDCLADVKGTVSVAIRNVPTAVTFELWSGTGCDQQANRAPTSVSRTCAKVRSNPSAVSQELEISFRDLIKPYGADETPAGPEVCEQDVANGLISRTLTYIIIDNAYTSKIATTPSWAFRYDIKGPPPPTNVKAEPGDSSLVTSFTATPNEPNLLKYHFYCSPKGTPPTIANQEVGGSSAGGAGEDVAAAGSDTGGVDGTGGTAGSAGSAGTAGTGVVIDPNCQSATLIPGEDVPATAKECGTVGAVGATGGETNPDLTNGDEYVVAVAAEDTVNNLGKLSNLACGVPKDARGFFENYRDAGGQAGGGYCSFAPARHAGVAALLGGLGAFALLLRRRQK